MYFLLLLLDIQILEW